MSARKFCVVKLDSGTLEIVPSNWISKDKKTCSFPPKWPTDELRKQVVNFPTPGGKWSKKEMNCLSALGTYMEAIKYAQKASVEKKRSHSNEDGCRRSKRIPKARSAWTPPDETKERKKTAEHVRSKKPTKVVEEPEVPKEIMDSSPLSKRIAVKARKTPRLEDSNDTMEESSLSKGTPEKNLKLQKNLDFLNHSNTDDSINLGEVTPTKQRPRQGTMPSHYNKQMETSAHLGFLNDSRNLFTSTPTKNPITEASRKSGNVTDKTGNRISPTKRTLDMVNRDDEEDRRHGIFGRNYHNVTKKNSPKKSVASGCERRPRGHGSANASFEEKNSNMSLGNSIDSIPCNDDLVYSDGNNGVKGMSLPGMDERLRSHGGMLVKKATGTKNVKTLLHPLTPLEMSQSIVGLEFDVRALYGILRQILSEVRNNNPSPVRTVVTNNKLPHFPITTISEFRKFNRSLKSDTELQALFEKEIDRVGGDDFDKFVLCVINQIFTRTVARMFTYFGTKPGKQDVGKYSFQATSICNSLRNVIFERFPRVKNDVIVSRIGRCLTTGGATSRKNLDELE